MKEMSSREKELIRQTKESILRMLSEGIPERGYGVGQFQEGTLCMRESIKIMLEKYFDPYSELFVMKSDEFFSERR